MSEIDQNLDDYEVAAQIAQTDFSHLGEADFSSVEYDDEGVAYGMVQGVPVAINKQATEQYVTGAIKRPAPQDDGPSILGKIETAINAPYAGLTRGVFKAAGNAAAAIGLFDQEDVDRVSKMIDDISDSATKNNLPAKIGDVAGSLTGQYILPAAVGYRAALPLAQAANLGKTAPLVASILAEGLTGLAAMSPNDENVFNMISEDATHPAAVAVRDLMATDPEDREWVNRARNAGEALVTLGGSEALIRNFPEMVRWTKNFLKSPEGAQIAALGGGGGILLSPDDAEGGPLTQILRSFSRSENEALGAGMIDVLDARAAQMDLPPGARVLPRENVPGVIDTSKEAYLRHPIKFEEDAHATAPRRPLGDNKKYPKSDRIRPLMDNAEKIAEVLAARAASEVGTNTQFFYHTGPIYEAAINVGGLSPDQARKWLKDFAEAYAATSPRTTTDQNLRNASLALAKREAGVPHREIVGPGTGGISEKGFPMMTGPSGIHGKLLDAVEGGGISRAANPKPSTFAANVEGNLSGVTVDTHAIRAAIDALNEIAPGQVPEQWILPEFRAQYKKDPTSLNPATMIDDTLASAKINGESVQVEYGPFADIYKIMAEKMGVSPAEAQSMGWFGSGERTGLASGRKTIAELLNERIDVTAQLLNISPAETAKKLFRREIPIASLFGAAVLSADPGEATAAPVNGQTQE
jgi:hypothetical protein